MKNKNVAFQINAVEKNIYFADEEPEIFFNITEVEGNKFKLKCNIDVFSYDIFIILLDFLCFFEILAIILKFFILQG